MGPEMNNPELISLDDSAIRSTVRTFLVESLLFNSGEALGDSDSLIGAGVIDSVGVLTLITFLEEAFEIQVADEDVVPENLDSLDNLAGFVGRKLAAR
jgi:acyl carrier protein